MLSHTLTLVVTLVRIIIMKDIGTSALNFCSGTLKCREGVVNSDIIVQEIIDHPWGAKGARRQGWVIVVSCFLTSNFK